MRFVRKFVLALSLVPLIGACTSPVTPTPTPQAAYVGTTPAYEEWAETWVKSYWEVQPGNGVIPLVYPLTVGLEEVEQGEIELLISASTPPDGWFATPLRDDAIAILVHPALSIDNLELQQLYDIFFGREDNWSAFEGEDQLILPIIPLQGDEVRTTFQSEVLRGARYTSNSLLAPHPRAALEMLEERAGGIAIVPWTSLMADQTPLKIEGVQLSSTNINNARYPLTLKIIAISPEEPVGPMRQFLGWLQTSLLSDS
jgi:phosphate transport system substrate-binding protein